MYAMLQHVACSVTAGYLAYLSDGGPAGVCLAVGLTWQWNSLGAVLSLATVSCYGYYQLYSRNKARIVLADPDKTQNTVRLKLRTFTMLLFRLIGLGHLDEDFCV